MSGKLYFVATPIGNLADISLRAIETLKLVDEILCEDTRTSLKLLNHYEIKKPLSPYHKFNYKTVIPKAIDKLLGGKNIALISDAGMPCISDPGAEIIPYLIENKLEYTVIPGVSAFTSAVALSGVSAPFTFIGFLPDNKKEERKVLEQLKNFPSTLIFYVAPHKLLLTLNTLQKFFGNRKCVSVREITKLHEEVEYFDLDSGYGKEPKGEYVLLVSGNENTNNKNELCDTSVIEHYKYYVALGETKNDAIKMVAKDRNVAKSIIYNEIVKEK